MNKVRIIRTFRRSAIILPLASGSAWAQAAGGGGGAGNTLGGMATRIAQDSLQWGALFTVAAYLLGAFLVLFGLYTLYAHSRNPNGQYKSHHGALALLVGGAVLAFNVVAGYGSQTVTGSAATATGANSQVLTIQ